MHIQEFEEVCNTFKEGVTDMDLMRLKVYDLRKPDRRFLSEQKAKLVYATRAMRRNQKLSISSTLRVREFSYLSYF